MSVSQFPKFAAMNDSSIPVPKRNNTGLKKHRRCAQLPELQKYIETIIKASNEYDSEDASLSENERFPKERKFGTYSVFKGIESKARQEKNKTELNLNRSKSNLKSKTPTPEAVSRGVNVSNMFAPEFEDPRNWKLVSTPNLGPSIEIEKFLKEFYPNPYRLESVTEFKQSKNKKDELRDGTLPDVIISEANIHNDVDIQKRDSDLKTADTQTCSREEKTLNETWDSSPDKESPPCLENNNEDDKIVEASTPCFLENSSSVKVNNSISNECSQISSPKSAISETLSKDNQVDLKNRKNTTGKSKHEALKMENVSDYDIGKLKLLNLSDSEHSLLMDKVKNSEDGEKRLSLNETTYSNEELELKEIYDIMHKATESFLFLRNDHADPSLECNVRTQELSSNAEANSSSKTKPDLNESAKIGKEVYSVKEEKCGDNSLVTVEETFSKEEPQIKARSLLNILLEEDKFKYTSKLEDRQSEQACNWTGIVSNYKTVAAEVSTRQISEEDKDFAATNQKIDEVLDFMYDCLRKFNKNRGRSKPEEEKPVKKDEKLPLKSTSWRKFQKDGVTNTNYEKPTTSMFLGQNEFASSHKETSTASLLRNAFPDIKEIQSKYTAALGEINRKASKNRGRKKPPLIFPLNDRLPHHQISVSGTPTPENPTVLPQPCQQVEEVYENSAMLSMQTVESQNELGGYTEEAQEPAVTNENTRIPKPICPLSAKRKKSKMNTTKKLKDVLDAEEKLLSVEPIERGSDEKANEEKSKDLIICKSEIQDLKQNETPKVYSQFRDFRRPSSNFLICLNSLPRNLKSLTSIQQKIPMPISTSLIDLKKDWNFRHLMLSPTYPLRRLSLTLEAGYKVLHCTYNIKQEALRTFSETVVLSTAQPVCTKIILQTAEEFLIRKCRCLVKTTVRPKEPVYGVDCAPAPKSILSPLEMEMFSEEERPVKALIEAIEDTEEKLFLLEQNSAENLSKNTDLCNLSAIETKSEFSETEAEKINDRKKIHELLIRTYNLQLKLQRYLQKVSYIQPISMSSASEGVLDFRGSSKTDTEVYMQSGNIPLPAVHWHLKSPETDIVLRADESVTVGAAMVDNSTSYDPPMEEESYEKSNETNQENKLSPPKNTNERVEEPRNDEDDQSSIYSFKSSNDVSENESGNTKKDSKHSEYKSNKKLFRKIFNEIESFRQSFEADKLEKQQHGDACPQEAEESEEKRLVQYDSKIPAKVLRTVFTGKKSCTELTIGLKDVPMTKLGNISVEKKKFSPNHTKISVAFMKESEPPNRVSSYFYDHTRQSLSTCLTEISGLKNGESKTSQSLIEESEEEDDFKSVASSMGNSDSEVEKEELQTKEQETTEMSPPKNYIKHRFDFYRKMNMDLESTKPKPKSSANSLCRYKELEPLKQALTEMQIRMRNIRRDAVFSSNDYYERALKLAKMSAGFCQSCGNRAVIPNDTFGYYKTLLPRRSMLRRHRHFRPSLSPNSSFYSLHSSAAEVGNQFCELGIKHSSYTLNPRLNSNRTILRSSLQDMPVLFERT